MKNIAAELNVEVEPASLSGPVNVVEAAYVMKGVNVIKVINVLRLVNIFKAFNTDNFVAFLRCIAPSRAVSAPQCESQIDRAMTGTKPTDAPLMDT